MNERLFSPDTFLEITRGFRLAKGSQARKDHFDVPVKSVCADSREAVQGSIFFALPGERTDGHQHIGEAFRNGASSAVAEVQSLSKDPGWFLQLPEPWKRRIIFVEDTQTALQESAKAWAEQFPHITRIGVTGSCGKTTTKEIISSILSREAKTVKNPGNRNSVVGLPLSLFSIGPEDVYGVFEMGVSQHGEMEKLADVYRPDIGLVTNIGTAHIGNFGSFADIAREKGKIFSKGAKSAYVNEQCAWANELIGSRDIALKLFGRIFTSGIEGCESLGLSGWVISYKGKKISFPLIGYHNLVNAFGAITLAEDLGASLDSIIDGLEAVSPLDGRGRVVTGGGVTVIEDCYNANADSMESMLSCIRSLRWHSGRVVLVLGAMKELGHCAPEYHRQLGRWIELLNPAAVFLYGKEMAETLNSLRGSPIRAVFAEELSRLQHDVLRYIRRGDLVLVKGSRVMEMEQVVTGLSRAG